MCDEAPQEVDPLEMKRAAERPKQKRIEAKLLIDPQIKETQLVFNKETINLIITNLMTIEGIKKYKQRYLIQILRETRAL